MDVGRPTPHRADDSGVSTGSEEHRGAADPLAVCAELQRVLANAPHERARVRYLRFDPLTVCFGVNP